MKVLLVDDSESFRDGLRSMLAAEPDVEVVAEAADGEEAVHLALLHQPDVVLMDLSMPGTDGLEATRRLTDAAPHVGVVALTLRSDDEAMAAALAAGARGYVVKGALRSELLWAVRAVAAGEAVFGPAVAARITQLFEHACRAARPKREFEELTDRELEVLRRMAAHQSNAVIARELGISDKTVRNHVSNVLTKLRAADRAEAIVRARESGLR
jgi:DNA-binding NarL/FixJ family response regulator